MHAHEGAGERRWHIDYVQRLNGVDMLHGQYSYSDRVAYPSQLYLAMIDCLLLQRCRVRS
jgi:hypothetical protein